ncbi:hypothetical protein GX586_13810 [bacterium]|nr:hypothetical protein [bacterium]
MNATNTLIALALLNVLLLCGTAFGADEALEQRQIEREERQDRKIPPVDTYVDREGWQSGIGFKEMEKYVTRLGQICSERVPGLVYGIAGGKKGILLNCTDKGQRGFYMAKENTEQFLTAIVQDLMKLPEPVAPFAVMNCRGKPIVQATYSRSSGKVEVKFLL